ncbi:LysR family transcriptional regulator [Arthrobacter sp. JSM 101049]|uniref:LysR family transcriptional regulator n=1 Tax=Arthrobacter sp. JSM 101049 TaxID=929097 RepID=UPI003567EF5A
MNRFPSPDDLLILLTVARLGRFTAVAEALETTHTTVSRRITALDRQLGGRTLTRTSAGWELTELGRHALRAAESIEASLAGLTTEVAQGAAEVSGVVRAHVSDAFGAYLAGPAMVRLQQDHPRLKVELLSATRRASRNRSGVDLEVVAGRVDDSRAEVLVLTEYVLRLFASPGYLREAGTPASLADLGQHRFVSYVDSELQVAELDYRATGLPVPSAAFQATSIFAQLEAVRAGGGIGMLPSYAVHGDPAFSPVLSGSFERRVTYSALARPESLRSPAVQAVIGAFLAEARIQREALVS